MKKNNFLLCGIVVLCLFSCKGNSQNEISQLVKNWSGKEIVFPKGLEFSLFGKEYVCDTIPKTDYKIVTYVDSIGCASCKLRLSSWKTFIQQLSTLNLNVPILFYLHPFEPRSLKGVLRLNEFNYPVCMDTEDCLNKLNHFPSNIDFQTFLLDKNNKIVAIGNPIHNPKVKELYLSILEYGKEKKIDSDTEVNVVSTMIDFGKFEQEQRDTVIYIKNVGNEKFITLDVVTSCGCTVIDYDNQPICPGDSLALKILYTADKKGYFNKVVNLYCNIKSSPIQFHIVGSVQ